VPHVSALTSFFSDKTALKLARCRRYLIVICSESGCPYGVQLSQLFISAKCREVRLCAETADFFSLYPFLFETSTTPARLPCRAGYPNEIIPGKLYLGDRFQAECECVFQQLKFTHVVNATEGVPNKFEARGVQYLRVGVQDSEEAEISRHFNAAHNFIDQFLSSIDDSDKTVVVFVHCAQGISRSATIVLMFLMRKYNLSFESALRYLKSQRYVVEPNPGFLRQLKLYQAQDP
jgi:dual specificity MAP kinase phosphatase